MEFKNLEFKNLDFSYQNGQELFSGVNFRFPMNANVAVHGDGGCGKSTLLKVLAGLESPRGGQYFVNELDVTDASFEEFIPYRLKIGYAMDFGGLIGNRTIHENIVLPVLYHKDPKVVQRLQWAEYLIDLFELNPVRGLRPHSVRGATRKAACIARSLVLQPEMLLLDNPTVGLDSAHTERLVDLLHEGRSAGWLRHLFVADQEPAFLRSLVCHDITIQNRDLVVGSFAGSRSQPPKVAS